MRPSQAPFFRFASGCIVTLVAFWIGLMIATAGIALHPPVARVATPFLCAGEVEFRSQSASYRPGEHIVTREILCTGADGKTAEDITFKAAGLSFLIYSAIAWLLLLVLLVPFVRRRTADTIEAAKLRFSPIVVHDVTVGDAPDGDAAARLARLKQLHEQGLITTADYEAKKAEILSGL